MSSREYWLEQQNGFWQTQLEYPGSKYGRRGGRLKIDAVIFNTFSQSSTSTSPIDFEASLVTANIYEIEPALKPGPSAKCRFDMALKEIVEGYAEAVVRWALFDGSSVLFPSSGSLNDYIPGWNIGQDGFNQIRTNKSVSSYPNGKFGWSSVDPQLGSFLSSNTTPRGPERISPIELGLISSNAGAYWVMLPVNGLILYIPENAVANFSQCAGLAAGAAIEEVFEYIYHKGQEWQKSRPDKGRASLPDSPLWGPPPVPVTAMIGHPYSPLWDIALTCNNGLCLNAKPAVVLGLTGIELLLFELALALA